MTRDTTAGLLVAGCLLLVASAGCVRRELTIRSEPPGAKLYLNDKLQGETPVTLDPVWYGWYRVMLRKDGYQRLDDHRKLKAPIYLWIPFDFIMEILPVPIRDTRTWSYSLTPLEQLPVPRPPMPGGAAAPATTTEPADAE